MPLAESLPPLDRRALLRSAILIVGGSLAGLPAVSLAQETPAGPRFFDAARFALLDEVTEIMIPRTDTPGAREAGVAATIDALMRDWASDRRQQEFTALLDAYDLAARARGGAALVRLPEAQRAEVVAAFDAARIDAGDPVYSKFKELVLTAYYLSEPGATQELRFELVPGSWQSGVPVGPDTRTWAV